MPDRPNFGRNCTTKPVAKTLRLALPVRFYKTLDLDMMLSKRFINRITKRLLTICFITNQSASFVPDYIKNLSMTD